MDNTESGDVRVKVGSVAFLTAAGSGYGIGLDDAGRRIEFIGDWRDLIVHGDHLPTLDLDVHGLIDHSRLEIGQTGSILGAKQWANEQPSCDPPWLAAMLRAARSGERSGHE